MFLGCHICRDAWRYVGVSLIVAAPTGNRSKSQCFFEPIVGNGHHTEIGIGFDGRALAWEAAGDHRLSFYGTIRATRLLASRQRRTFDFCRNGFGSRYILLKEFDDNGVYNGNLVSASTVTTLPCKVWARAQFDLVAMLGYLSECLEIDVGYNAWVRSHEKLCLLGSIPANRYGMKGIQNVTNYLGEPDNTTQSDATIYGNELTPESQHAHADKDSPVFITTGDLNLASGASGSAFTHKFFGHIGHTWHTCCSCAQPYLGCGGEVEFEGLLPRLCRQSSNNTLAQWGIWLKGGFYF